MSVQQNPEKGKKTNKKRAAAILGVFALIGFAVSIALAIYSVKKLVKAAEKR